MTQAILPIRGKTINVEKNDMQSVMASETVKLILSTLGCGVGEDYSEKDLKYDKVILLSDGDTDGAHITILLLSLLYSLVPNLIKNGHVYTIKPPLYRIKTAEGNLYAVNEKEKDEVIKKLKTKNYMISRFKGSVA